MIGDNANMTGNYRSPAVVCSPDMHVQQSENVSF